MQHQMRTALALAALTTGADSFSQRVLLRPVAGFVSTPHSNARSTVSRRVPCPRPAGLPTVLFQSTNADYEEPSGVLERIASTVSQTMAVRLQGNSYGASDVDTARVTVQIKTLVRVGLPSVLSGLVAYFAFPFMALTMAGWVNDPGVFAVLSQDSSQFVQNFLTVSGLLFSILVGQSYSFMYTQQESVYYALFEEVTEAKSLLEQVALVCQGRSMYQQVLACISNYVRNDLRQLQCAPAQLLSSRPVDDPLESIMYLTSVGVPSTVYETVRSLRQARARRLGALQRKLPSIHMLLLWVLAAIELGAFPLLGAGTQTIGGYNILTVEGALFGVMTFGIVMTLRVVGELWRPAGGAYNVDGVLSVMVSGLVEELDARMSGSTYSALKLYPSASASLEAPSLAERTNIMEDVRPSLEAVVPSSIEPVEVERKKVLQQGAGGSVLFRPIRKVGRWIIGRK